MVNKAQLIHDMTYRLNNSSGYRIVRRASMYSQSTKLMEWGGCPRRGFNWMVCHWKRHDFCLLCSIYHLECSEVVIEV